MPLAPGTRFGPYEVAEPIGSGGMGEVYRARDTTLERDVAIKVLPESFASDESRVARFEHEARTLASLNHANIAQIHGLERADGTTAIVMELVEGPTLADRIEQGRIPVDEALAVALQIADALEAAHGRGIVHRDLKPANVKRKPDGTVKVLDFGIAKALDTRAASGPGVPSLTTPAMTQAGIVLGTAAYMAPEQARGKLVDERADIWAFGCVLYEMLTGQPAFAGEDVSVTLARILERDTDMTRLPAAMSSSIQRAIELCLRKDVGKRIADIRDVRLVLDGAFDGDASPASPSNAARKAPVALVSAVLAAAVVAALAWLVVPRPGPAPPTRFTVGTPDGEPLAIESPLAVSPDGRELVFTVGLGDDRRLFRRNLDRFETLEIDGGRGGLGPFFSPAGDAIGFFSPAAGQLQRLDLTGGTPTPLVDSGDVFGTSWGLDGSLVFVPEWGMPLRIVRPGAPEAVDLTRVDLGARETSHLWPQILPDGRSVLFTIWSGAPSWGEAQLAVGDLETGRHEVVLRGGAFGRYVASGHLVFWRADALMAVGFDLDMLAVRGEPVRVVQDVRLESGKGAAHFAISDGGTLAYVHGAEDAFSETFIVDRSGQRLGRLDATMDGGFPKFSPDGARVALTLYRGGTFGIGVFELERGVLTPVAMAGDHINPLWRDDDRLTFVSNLEGEYNHYEIAPDGSGTPVPLFSEPQGFTPSGTWSPDGRYLAYAKLSGTEADIWLHEPGAAAEPRALIASAADESGPAFSPDGLSIAYHSDESGVNEVYVRPFPNVDARRQLVSSEGGSRPVWSRDGNTLFYASQQGLMQVGVSYDTERVPSFGRPAPVLEMRGIMRYDVSPDGETFAIERVPIETAATEVHVVVNWLDELERLVPTR